MSLYAVGDLQGCLDPLQRLLDTVRFDPAADTLWLTGDLVNRGPQSLAALRFVRSLGAAAVTVLGNHDLHLLAVAFHQQHLKKKDTLNEILAAPDRDELLGWLLRQPLLHHDEGRGLTLLHAGLPPSWDVATARRLAAEVEAVLRGPEAAEYFRHMYGDHPERWDEGLSGWDRLRFVTNALTRMRFATPDGRLDLRAKGPPGTQEPGYLPWFELPARASAGSHVVFGHWAAMGMKRGEDYTALDSGCVWGNRLTAVRFEGEERHFASVPCGG